MSDLIFNLSGAQEAVNEKLASLTVGVHELTIEDVTQKRLENEKGSEYIAITIRNKEKTQMNEERFFISSEKALVGTTSRIKHLVHAVAGPEAAEQNYSFSALRKLLIGKSFRGNIVGEEFKGQDGKIYVKTSLAYSGFAESLSIPAESSGLKVRKVKPLAEEPTNKTLAPSAELAKVADELNF